MQLTHKIALKPTKEQKRYFQRAAGTARFVWNWALSEWKRQFLSRQKPKAMALKRQFNQIKYAQFPWLSEMHRDSHSQPFTYLGNAWQRFLRSLNSINLLMNQGLKRKANHETVFMLQMINFV